jgi:hypothetical protein
LPDKRLLPLIMRRCSKPYNSSNETLEQRVAAAGRPAPAYTEAGLSREFGHDAEADACG